MSHTFVAREGQSPLVSGYLHSCILLAGLLAARLQNFYGVFMQALPEHLVEHQMLQLILVLAIFLCNQVLILISFHEQLDRHLVVR